MRNTCTATQPAGDHRHEFQVAFKLVSCTAPGDIGGFLAAIEALNEESAALLGLAVGPHGAALDAALQALESPPKLIVEIGCSIGCAAIRASRFLQHGGNIIACEADAFRAAVALCLVEWAGLTSTVHVWVGRAEQLMPRLCRAYGAGSVDALLLNPQGIEYQEDLGRAEGLGLLAKRAVVIADHVLQPMAPEFMWLVCNSGVYRSTVVSIANEWMVVALRVGAAVAASAVDGPLHLWPWSPPPPAVSQLRHCADEARRRSVAWRCRDRLSAIPPPVQPEEAEAMREAYAAVGIIPHVSWPYRAHGRWCVELPPGVLRFIYFEWT